MESSTYSEELSTSNSQIDSEKSTYIQTESVKTEIEKTETEKKETGKKEIKKTKNKRMVVKIYNGESLNLRLRKIKGVEYYQSEDNVLFATSKSDTINSPVGKIDGKKCTFFKKKY